MISTSVTSRGLAVDGSIGMVLTWIINPPSTAVFEDV
jgi:hypothetical protein